ncbi:ATP-dependent helicase [Campylobacter sp. MIT 21-1685]|uniref:ATP-dependent helicase n=1 Tax=unclassified Campylobacter TaxID=2593542 RepID=UPI00224B469E|nr:MULTISPECIES: ATP-dependent helicase [unclassified Campylobacter]MCX2682997.1 ATP-dependent helicase [Campylobacter sp. MIT 21-1684]MCX2751279.1 ATP-dependent helicase [Campylobacter sp. MIT 21-1682]MCX2807478.1 ATP-dependent helicase [Campylobacter sp. MIT 21-1685]
MPLSRLNQEQLQAASANFGYNLIIASAGTGKTSTIVARIAFLLQQGVQAEKILLLTFTNKASKEMINRLNRYFPTNITNKILAGTFHSTAYTLLKNVNNNIILKQASELKILLRSVYEKYTFTSLSDLKPYQASYLYELYSLFYNKTQGEDFSSWFCKNYEEQSIYAPLYQDILREYENEKKKFNYVDFNDLLLNLKELLTRKQLEFDEILVDEYQDTNALQSSLIEAFQSKSLFCVGDYDQSIYAFNGADINIIGSFQYRFKNARIFSLNKNYRSSRSILALANKVILNNERLYPKELIVTRDDENRKPILLTFEELFDQYKNIAQIILASGVHLEDIAIIFRNNSSADGMEVALRELGIACVRKGSGSFFESLEVKVFCAFLALLVNPKDIMAFIYLMQYTKGVGVVLAKELFDALIKLGYGSIVEGFLNPDLKTNLHNFKKNSYELGLFAELNEFTNETRFELQSEFHSNPILKFAKINQACAHNLEAIYFLFKQSKGIQDSIKVIDRICNNTFFQKICEELAIKRATNRAGELDVIKKEENKEKIQNKINILREFASKYSEIQSYYNFLVLGSNEINSGKGVSLLSIHASKGLEFELVFVIDLAQDRFPNKKLINMGGSLEEERRLFYVAVTRAKNMLYLSYAKYDKNKKISYTPSCFLQEAGLYKKNKKT